MRAARALWRRLAEAGVFALAVRRRTRGSGPLPVELAVAFVELGRHAVPGPLVETVAAAALLAGLTDPGAGQAAAPGAGLGRGDGDAARRGRRRTPWTRTRRRRRLTLSADGNCGWRPAHGPVRPSARPGPPPRPPRPGGELARRAAPR